MPVSAVPLRRPASVVALLALTATAVASTGSPAAAAGPSVFLNEIHYDNSGTDTGEFFEVAGPAGTSLTGWSVELYNGNGGGSYGTVGLSGTLADTHDGYSFVTRGLPTNGLQNGSPDGLALVDDAGAVVQFLSYEGAFTATDGPAAGSVSTDIGVAESSGTAAGSSLQLTGSGIGYDDFTWTGPAAGTPGAANTGQSFAGRGDSGAGGGDLGEGRGGAGGEGPGITLISTVQGNGPSSPHAGAEVTVRGVVTSLLTSEDAVDGFFLQEEDADADGDPTTSEGLFVFCRGGCPDTLQPGMVATVTGQVNEFFGSTQIGARDGRIDVGPSATTPAPVSLSLPAESGTDQEATFEPVEGMRVTFSDTLAVSEYFELARFGTLVLTADERPYQFTHDNEPSTMAYAAHQQDLATRRIILDDASNDQNDAISGASDEPYPYPEGGLSVANTVRGGDTIDGLTGVMDWSFGAWRVRPVPDETYTFTPANPRPASPAPVGGDLRVASFNVLNYFTTIDDTSSRSSGPCGPSRTLDCRGADSEAELERQRAKIVAALLELDADVAGLIEIQNDDGAATADLVAALDAATAPGTYDYVDTGALGTDAIKVALLYQPAAVTPVGPYAVLDSSVDPRFVDDKNRPTLIQTFEENGTGERFTAAVNHLKSKGSTCEGDPDLNDGQGSCNETRTQAAKALADFLATDPTGSGDPDVLVLGDLNSYRNEDPITALAQAGYTDLLAGFVGDDAYTYVFDGQLGYLDYALANTELLCQVTGATAWHANADEVPLLDYNDAVRDSGESSFERESAALPLYDGDPFRASDHDAVLVGLDLVNTPPVADAGGPYEVRVGRSTTLDGSGSTDADDANLSFAWDLDGDGVFDDATGVAPAFDSHGRSPGSYPVAVRVSDGSDSSIDETVVDVVVPGRGNGGRPSGHFGKAGRPLAATD